MTELLKAYQDFKAALEPLAVDIGPETLDVWHDRRHHGQDPLPPDALQRLAEVAERLLSQYNHSGSEASNI